MASLETFHYRTYAFDTSSEVLNIYIYIHILFLWLTLFVENIFCSTPKCLLPLVIIKICNEKLENVHVNETKICMV